MSEESFRLPGTMNGFRGVVASSTTLCILRPRVQTPPLTESPISEAGERRTTIKSSELISPFYDLAILGRYKERIRYMPRMYRSAHSLPHQTPYLAPITIVMGHHRFPITIKSYYFNSNSSYGSLDLIFLENDPNVKNTSLVQCSLAIQKSGDRSGRVPNMGRTDRCVDYPVILCVLSHGTWRLRVVSTRGGRC